MVTTTSATELAKARPEVSGVGTASTDAGALERIRLAADHLSGVRQRVAQHVAEDPWRAQGMSITQMAVWTGASENAISRLTLAMDYAGYRDFMQALSIDLGKSLGFYHVHPVEVADTASSAGEGTAGLVKKVVDLEIACLQETLSRVPESVLEASAEILSNAEHIVLIGTGTAAPLCQLVSYRLTSSGIAATWTNDPMAMVAEVCRLTSRDAVLAVSFSGRSRDTVQTTALAKKRGVPTVTLSAQPDSPLSIIGDANLFTYTPRLSQETLQFGARVAGLALLEALATAVSVRADKGSTAHLRALGSEQDRWNTLPADWTMPS